LFFYQIDRRTIAKGTDDDDDGSHWIKPAEMGAHAKSPASPTPGSAKDAKPTKSIKRLIPNLAIFSCSSLDV
jgi:hypothetical protein